MPATQSTSAVQRASRMDALHYYFGLLDGVYASCLAVVLTEQPVGRAAAEAHLGAAVARSPRLRQGLRPVLGNVARPLWVDDRDFAVGHHVREIDFGGDGTRSEVIARTHTWRITEYADGRSPWEVGLVRGLADGGGAVLIRFHHALADGLGLFEQFAPLFDAAPAPASRPAGTTARLPGIARQAVAERCGAVAQMAKAVRKLPADLRKPSVRMQLASSVAGLVAPPPAGRLTRSLTPGSSATYAVPTALWSARAREAGGGSNDLFLALAAAAVRDSGILGDKPAYRTAMPINLRAAGKTAHGNDTGVAFLALDGNAGSIDDLRAMRAHVQAGKAASSRDANPAVEHALDLLPGKLQAWLTLRQWAKKDILATNVVLPHLKTMCGTPIETMLASPALVGGPLCFVLLTRGDQRVMHVHVDRGLVADDQRLFDCLGGLLAECFGPDQVDAVVGSPAGDASLVGT